MHKGRISLVKPFSLRQSTNFSNRNILKKHESSKSGKCNIKSKYCN
jgi:hypothetical protein